MPHLSTAQHVPAALSLLLQMRNAQGARIFLAPTADVDFSGEGREAVLNGGLGRLGSCYRSFALSSTLPNCHLPPERALYCLPPLATPQLPPLTRNTRRGWTARAPSSAGGLRLCCKGEGLAGVIWMERVTSPCRYVLS